MKISMTYCCLLALQLFSCNSNKQEKIKQEIEQDCGEERWNVKTLSDDDTAFINFDCIIQSTVYDQIKLTTPYNILDSRLVSETPVYSIDCYILEYKEEEDRDIHVIIQGINTDETMVIEIVNPECSSIKRTSRYNQLKELYEWFTRNIGIPTNSFISLDKPKLATITGIGFWDFLHGQNGMAENGREIHPVLSMKLKL